jgi:Tfp pilus assembly protein PilO
MANDLKQDLMSGMKSVNAPEPVEDTEKPEIIEKEVHPSSLFVDYYGAIVLLVIGLAIGSAVIFLRPIINDIKQTNAQIEQRIGTIQDERRYLSTLEQSVAAAESIPSDTLQKVEDALPDDSAIPSLLLQFGDAAARHGLRIDNISFVDNRPVVNAPRAATTTGVLPVDITVSLRARNYLDVKRFLTDVESSLRLLDIVGMTSGQTGNELAYTLQFRSYVFSPQTRPTP